MPVAACFLDFIYAEGKVQGFDNVLAHKTKILCFHSRAVKETCFISSAGSRQGFTTFYFEINQMHNSICEEEPFS